MIPKIISGILVAILIAVALYFLIPSVWFWIGFELLATLLVAVGCGGEWYLQHHPSGRKTKEKDGHHKLESRFIAAVVIGVFMEFFALAHAIPAAIQLERDVAEIGTTNSQLVAANLVLQSNVNETKTELANAEIRLAEIKNAIPPRQISEKERELFISVLINSGNVSPKIPIKVLAGDLNQDGTTNQEVEKFAIFIRQMLNDAGYGTKDEPIVRIPPFIMHPNNNINDSRNPAIFVIFATDNTGKEIPKTIQGGIGNVGLAIPTALAIPSEIGNKNVPTLYRYTTNPNAIIYGICDIFDYIRFRPSELNAPGILKPGEVGFYIPPQVQ